MPDRPKLSAIMYELKAKITTMQLSSGMWWCRKNLVLKDSDATNATPTPVKRSHARSDYQDLELGCHLNL